MMDIVALLEWIDRFLWNGFLIYLVLAVGILYTVRLKGMQFRYLPLALKYALFRRDDKARGDISQFQSLMTAMAATIGIGSIAGMATAVMTGGFGAIFWMWVVALIGMATKFAEASLAVKYRKMDRNNQMAGGPMYYLEKGIKSKRLAIFFAIFGVCATFGGGNMIQAQSIADALHDLISFPPICTSFLLVLSVGIAIFGGVKKLGKINAIFVPFMALFYVFGGVIIIYCHMDAIPHVISAIVRGAFSFQSAIGGFCGASMMTAIQMGIARGISSNEAGLGSGPIAAAAAKTDMAGRQALISMSGVFLSSFVICTITVLVIGVTGVVGTTDIAGNVLNGAPLVMAAFRSVIPGGGIIVAIGIILFGFSTLLGWSYYGQKCIEYLFGEKIVIFYRIFFLLVVFLGAILSLQVVWPFADITNGLMALPNIIGLIFLSKEVVIDSEDFFLCLKQEKKISEKILLEE